jgi:hypothetical protein
MKTYPPDVVLAPDAAARLAWTSMGANATPVLLATLFIFLKRLGDSSEASKTTGPR